MFRTVWFVPAALALALAAACSSPVVRPTPTKTPTLLAGESVAMTTEPAATPRGQGGDVVIAALNYLDQPYRAGGHSAERGFDCSGFTRQVYAQTLGLMLPRQADEQAQARGLLPVRRSDLQAGDLVFFNTLRRTYSHVGIYVGEGRFIHAPRSGTTVRVESIEAPYWTRRFTGARRPAAITTAS